MQVVNRRPLTEHPQGWLVQSKKCRRVSGEAASILPSSTHTGHCSFLVYGATRAAIQPQPPSTSRPQVLSFSHFHLLQKRETCSFTALTRCSCKSNTLKQRHSDNHVLLVSHEASCSSWHSWADLEEQS